MLLSCPVLFLLLPCPFLPSQSLPPSFPPFSCWMPVEKEEGGRGKSSTLLFSLSPKILFFPTPVLFSYSHQSHPSVDLSVCLLPLSPPLSFLPPPRVEQLSDPRARADRWTFPPREKKKAYLPVSPFCVLPFPCSLTDPALEFFCTSCDVQRLPSPLAR